MIASQQFHYTPLEIHFFVVVFVLAMLAMMAFRFLQWLGKNILLLIVLRWFFLGDVHHGENPTNATFWRHGTETKRTRGREGLRDRWEHKPGYQRLLWRWGCLLSAIGFLYGSITEWTVTSHAVEALMVYGVVCLGFVIESKISLRVHNRHVINPVVKSLAPVLRLSPHAVRRMLHIKPENLTDEGEVGYLQIPPEITPSPEQQATIARVIDAHLPVDTEMDWQLQQAPKLGVIRAGLRPPPEVTWAEMLPLMKDAEYGEYYTGKTLHGEPYLSNFIRLDAAHWLASVQTQYGKSNWLGLMAVQILHQDAGAQITVIDPKEESLIDFLGAPWSGPGVKPLLKGVHMANDPNNVEGMIDAVHRARLEMDDRRSKYARNRARTFPLHVVMLDELNMFAEMVDGYWKSRCAENDRLPKEEREYLPKECPVWADIRAMIFMGRFVGIHVLAVAQDFRAEIIGGKGARNGFGLRALGGFIPSQWKMVVGTTPVPALQNGKGRWIFWKGEQQDWVQITKCDREAAYDYAADRTVRHHVGDDEDYSGSVPALTVGSGPDTDLAASLLRTATTVTARDTRRVIVGVKAAAQYLGYDKWRTFDTARSRRPVAGEFMQGRNVAWFADDLDVWYRGRGKNTRTSDTEG